MGAWEIKRQAAMAGWAERVRECRSSGLPVSTWCEEQGIERKTYYRWEREVLKLVGEHQGAAAAQVEFAQLAPAPVMQTQRDENGGAKVCVRVGRAIVEVHPGADLELVGALCRVLDHAE